MKQQQKERVIIVTAKTRLAQLKKKFNTVAQTKFYLERMGGDFNSLQREDQVLNRAFDNAQRELRSLTKTKVISKEYLPNYIFAEQDIVVVIGQDGLVANTAKYATNIPIIGVNPDPKLYDGVLLPFQMKDIYKIVEKALNGHINTKSVTMAEAKLNDGQRLLAFNDLFIGPQTHRSARYKLTYNTQTEAQSSSGIIVSTGAGSTGWLSSLINMANGINTAFAPHLTRSVSMRKTKAPPTGTQPIVKQQRLAWDTNKLVFIVREPFQSRTSKVGITAGSIVERSPLEIESMMSEGGVIFSDGIESDFLSFNSGTVATIGIAPERAELVVD